jgi:hypothetical protein
MSTAATLSRREWAVPVADLDGAGRERDKLDSLLEMWGTRAGSLTVPFGPGVPGTLRAVR